MFPGVHRGNFIQPSCLGGPLFCRWNYQIKPKRKIYDQRHLCFLPFCFFHRGCTRISTANPFYFDFFCFQFLIFLFIFLFSVLCLCPVETEELYLPMKHNISENVLDDQTLELVVGQRGKHLLVIDGYTFAKNNVSERTVYWCCRIRTNNRKACRARVTTMRKDNGLYKVTITQPFHNHAPTYRMKKKLDKKIKN